MRAHRFGKSGLVAAALWLAACLGSGAQDNGRPKPANDRANENEIARYCANIAPSAAEARLSYRLKALSEIDTRVREALDALDKRESEARDWVVKRQELMKAANDDLVAIYSKISAEAGAAQIGAMNDVVAASLLAKLKPQVAADILNEMDPDKASHLTTMISGASAEADKS
jgi:flagellar motility protein MotE (MotC chaperone)